MAYTLERGVVQTDLETLASPYQINVCPARAVGRPLFGGKNETEVVAKLQYAFSIGATPKEACGFAGISTDAFYRYCNKHGEFRDKVELLQAIPTLLARMTIFQSIMAGDIKTCMWYLERKHPEEFSVRSKV